MLILEYIDKGFFIEISVKTPKLKGGGFRKDYLVFETRGHLTEEKVRNHFLNQLKQLLH